LRQQCADELLGEGDVIDVARIWVALPLSLSKAVSLTEHEQGVMSSYIETIGVGYDGGVVEVAVRHACELLLLGSAGAPPMVVEDEGCRCSGRV